MSETKQNPLPCGCKAVTGHIPPATVEFCPMHAKAPLLPEMAEALRAMIRFYDGPEHRKQAETAPNDACPICNGKAVLARYNAD